MDRLSHWRRVALRYAPKIVLSHEIVFQQTKNPFARQKVMKRTYAGHLTRQGSNARGSVNSEVFLDGIVTIKEDDYARTLREKADSRKSYSLRKGC